MEVFMKGIFNKMLVAALLVSVVPGMYAMEETTDLKNVDTHEVINNGSIVAVRSAEEILGCSPAEDSSVELSRREAQDSNDDNDTERSHRVSNDKAYAIRVDGAVARFKLLDKTLGASSAVMYVAGKACSLASDHKYVTGYVAADTLFRGKKSFVGSFAGSLCSVKGLVGLAAAYGVYKAAPIVSGYYTDTIAPTVGNYYSETIAPKVTTCYSGVSSFFGGISNKVGSAYDYFKKPVTKEDTDIEMVSIKDEESDDEIVEISVTPVATPRQRSRTASPAPTKPLPVAPASVVEKKNEFAKNPMPTRVAPTRSAVRTQPAVRTESTVVIHQDDVKPSVDAVVLEKNKSVVAEMAQRFNNKK
jgi:hypothetical protein